jgi:GNAT superfamily N-acetyltransferase
MIGIRLDPFPALADFAGLRLAAWGEPWIGDIDAIHARSLVHAGAYEGDRLVGYVNVAWDGGVHAFLLDTTVRPDFQRQGIATRLVRAVTEASKARGAIWLHVDYDPHLEAFYAGCGFRPTLAGLIALSS